MSPPGTAPPPAGRRRRSAVATAALVVLVVLVAAGTAIAVTRGDGPKASSGSSASPQVALVVPSTPAWSGDPSTAYEDAVESAHTQLGIETQTFYIDLKKPGLSGLPKGARESIGNSGLVLLAGQFVGDRFVREFARHPHTRFVVVDPDPQRHRLYTAVTRNRRNTSDVFFAEGSGAYLAGFLGALMARKSAGKRPVISMVGSYPKFDVNVRPTFLAGAKKAVADVRVRFGYSNDVADPAKCAAIANRQIAQGSRVVYADAGGCSPGALSAVEAHRGVWGIEGDQAPSTVPGTRIIGYTVKDFGGEVDYAIRHYLTHTLSDTPHVDIGIERAAVDFVPTANLIPASFLARLTAVRHKMMPHWKSWATPMTS